MSKSWSLLLIILIASTAKAEINYITGDHCADQGIGCRLGTEQLGSAEPFQAEFTVAYRFTCTPTGTTYQSRISIFSTDDLGSRKSFNYHDAQTLTVEGMGPLRLEDSFADELSSVIQPPGCGLFINLISVKPSAWQIGDWAAKRAGVMDDLAAVKRLYDSRPALLFWRHEYGANPTQFRGFIEQTITSLKGQLAAPCQDGDGGDFDDFVTCELIHSYQDILDGAPDTAVNATFAAVKATALPIIASGRKLVADKQTGGQGTDTELSTALDATAALIGP